MHPHFKKDEPDLISLISRSTTKSKLLLSKNVNDPEIQSKLLADNKSLLSSSAQLEQNKKKAQEILESFKNLNKALASEKEEKATT